MTSCSPSPEVEIRIRLARAEARRRGLTVPHALAGYRYDPEGYIREKLGWEPWGGSDELPGQREVIEAYTLALRQQHEKKGWDAGVLTTEELTVWTPGQPIKNRLRIEAGHTVGKTKLTSGLVNHFFDCFPPSIIYTFAPTWVQIHDLLWKEIKTDRRGKGLPGRILDLRLDISDNHFATGKATSDAGGKGTERVQGQHNTYLMFAVDEAEGVPDFIWGAIDSMESGGIVIVLMLANPRTRGSQFHKQRLLSVVKNFRISCLQHPNVIQGKEIIPGAVQRRYVEVMVEKHCSPVAAHDDDQHTFELPFDLRIGEELYPAGTVFQPNAEFLFRVQGIAPANIADNTLVPVGRYEAATKRKGVSDFQRHQARFGVDVARYGKDFGTLYRRVGMRARRVAQFWHQDTNEYVRVIKAEALALPKAVSSLHIRVDAGGGFGNGVIDRLKIDDELIRRFPDFAVCEVHFNGTPSDPDAYFDLATEMYAEAAETLKGLAIESAPELLEGDLCERRYKWRNVAGIEVKKLESKDEFRKPERAGRSPDDGDGFMLAISPDRLFAMVMSLSDLPEGGSTTFFGAGINL